MNKSRRTCKELRQISKKSMAFHQNCGADLWHVRAHLWSCNKSVIDWFTRINTIINLFGYLFAFKRCGTKGWRCWFHKRVRMRKRIWSPARTAAWIFQYFLSHFMRLYYKICDAHYIVYCDATFKYQNLWRSYLKFSLIYNSLTHLHENINLHITGYAGALCLQKQNVTLQR